MNKKSLRKLMFIRLVIPACLSFIFTGSIVAQETDQVKEEMFREAREAFHRATEESVPFFSPNNFAKANEFYQKALADFEKGERLRTIRENLKQAKEYLETAFETSRIAHVALEGLINTRLETIELAATKLMAPPEQPEYFKVKLLSERDFQDEQSYYLPKAENKYKTAVLKIESGDLNSARSLAQDAEADYRSSAIMLLTYEVLGDANRRLQEVKDTLPANSMIKARAELAELELFLENQKREKFSVGELSAEIHHRVQDILVITGARVPHGGWPDLAAEELTVNPERPILGEEFSVHALIRNTGEVLVEDIRVLFLGPQERELGSGFIDSLEPGLVTEVGIVLTAEAPGNRLVAVVVDPENNIQESDERNNEVRKALDIGERPDVPEQNLEPVIDFSEGKALEARTRGIPSSRLPQNLYKTPKEWHEIFSMKYSEMIELNPGEKKDFPFEFVNASLIFIKIYSYGTKNEEARVLAELYRDRQPQPVWSGESVNMNNATGFISGQVEIAPEILALATTWTLKLINRTNQSMSTEVWIGVAPRLQ